MNRFSPKVKEVISKSRGEAVRLGHDYIGTEHLLLGITMDKGSLAVKVLQSLEVDTNELRQVIEDSVPQRSPRANYNVGNLPLNKHAEKVLKVTFLEARMLKDDEIGLEHLLLSILKHKNLASNVLEQFDVDYEIFKTELQYVSQEIKGQSPSDEYDDDENQGRYQPPRGGSNPQQQQQQRGAAKSRTPVLDNFGRDVTKLAEEDKLDPIIGRESEIERVSQILSRRKKNNPILIGEPGVGKTAIVEGLALRIVQ